MTTVNHPAQLKQGQYLRQHGRWVRIAQDANPSGSCRVTEAPDARTYSVDLTGPAFTWPAEVRPAHNPPGPFTRTQLLRKVKSRRDRADELLTEARGLEILASVVQDAKEAR